MTLVTCRLTAKNWDQLRNPTLSNQVWGHLSVCLYVLITTSPNFTIFSEHVICGHGSVLAGSGVMCYVDVVLCIVFGFVDDITFAHIQPGRGNNSSDSPGQHRFETAAYTQTYSKVRTRLGRSRMPMIVFVWLTDGTNRQTDHATCIATGRIFTLCTAMRPKNYRERQNWRQFRGQHDDESMKYRQHMVKLY